MPRHTLPSCIKSLMTYEVQLTKTTEEELLEFFLSKKDKIQELEPYMEKLDNHIEKLFQQNPYCSHDWRVGPPERIESLDWLGDIQQVEKYFSFFNFRNDLKLCFKEFKWDNEELSQFFYTYDTLIQTQLERQKQFNELEKLRYDEAKRIWEENNKDWIERKKLEREHQSHKPRQYYIELFKVDKYAEERYGGVIPNHEETCSLCKANIEMKRQQEEAERRYLEEQQRENQRYEEEKLAKLQKEKEQRGPFKTYDCECCNYHTGIKVLFDDHIKTTEHKSKSRYCSICQTQCRSDMDYQHHIGSRKHKIQTGEIKNDDETLFCECCNHTSTTKQNHQTHLSSNKHKINSGELQSQKQTEWHCELCNHTSTTKQNHQVHLNSKKHKKLEECSINIPTYPQ